MSKKSDNSFLFLRFHFFHVFIFLSKLCNFEIRKVRSNCLDFYLAFLLHFAVCDFYKVHTDSISESLKLHSHSSPLSQTRSWKLQFCIV